MQKPNSPVVLFVSHKYPPATGGMEKQSYELIKGLAVLTPTYKIVYDGSESIIQFFRKLNRRILEKIKLHPEINIIHFNDGLIASLALFHKKYSHLKRVVTVHGLDVVFPLRYFQHHILPEFNQYDQIIAVSTATAQAIVERGVNAEKVTVISNGIDQQFSTINPSTDFHTFLDNHHLPKEKQYIVTLGRPVKRKGFSWFIKHVLPALNTDIHLLMIGPLDQKASLTERILSLLPKKLKHLIMLFLGFPSDASVIRKLLQDNIYRHRVSHLGKLSSNDLNLVLASAMAFIMPNIKVEGDMEGFGLVCLEASVSRTIVLASEIEGITDAIKHKQNGFLIPSENPQAWIDKLHHIYTHKEHYESLKQNFRSYTINNYSWERMSLCYLKVFEELIDVNTSATTKVLPPTKIKSPLP